MFPIPMGRGGMDVMHRGPAGPIVLVVGPLETDAFLFRPLRGLGQTALRA